MDFTGIFQTVWGWILAAVGGLSFTGILTAVIWVCLKGSFNRAIEKANLKKTQEDAAEQAAEKAVDKIKNVSFKQSLQPVVESQLKKVSEEAQEMVKAELEEVNANYTKLLNVLEALSKYFDNSIGVSEDAKAELKSAIAQAREEKVDEHLEEEIKVEQEKEEVAEKPKKSSSTRVER